MAKSKKIATPEERRRAQDKRLLHKYGINIVYRDKLILDQNNKCKVCSGPLDAYGHPCVDHFHFPIDVHRVDFLDAAPEGMKWCARGYNEKRQVQGTAFGVTKLGARAEVKKLLAFWAVRGLLCYKCNYALGVLERFFDAARKPENLYPVIEYFRARLKIS